MNKHQLLLVLRIFLMRQRLWLCACLAALALVACSSDGNSSANSGPRLVQNVTLAPTTPAPTRALSPTPSPVAIAVSTSEIVSPLQVVTIEADYLLVTPTLPPSKTPTQTPTITPTFTVTPTPSTTVTATATAPTFPTSIVVPVTAIVNQPLAEVCDSTWFFIDPRPEGCPVSEPVTSQGSFQQFQEGYMIWVSQMDAIYVLYDTSNQPRWEVYNDTFQEGMLEYDPAFNAGQPPYTWQPRRGFGTLWRSNSVVRQRIGWAVREWEEPYSVQVQTAPDGTIFVQEPRGGVISMSPNGAEWRRYESYEGFQP
jgi:hypothetical protein